MILTNGTDKRTYPHFIVSVLFSVGFTLMWFWTCLGLGPGLDLIVSYQSSCLGLSAGGLDYTTLPQAPFFHHW